MYRQINRLVTIPLEDLDTCLPAERTHHAAETYTHNPLIEITSYVRLATRKRSFGVSLPTINNPLMEWNTFLPSVTQFANFSWQLIVYL